MRNRIGGGLAALLGAAIAIAVAAPGALAAGPVARAARVGSAPGAQLLTLDLPLRTDTAGLARFAAAVSDPSSPEYGLYEPVAMLSRRFGATPAQRRHVVSYLRSVGATDVSIDVTGQFADATMPVATAARVFGTGLASFRVDAASGVQRFVAPTAAVHVPAALAGSVTGVIGLDTEPFQQPQPAPLPAPSARRPRPAACAGCWPGGPRDRRSARPRPPTSTLVPDISPRTGTPAGCPQALAQPNGFTPNQYRQAYNIGVDPAVAGNGAGERVALVEIDGFKPSDITTFASCFGLPAGRIKVFHVGVHHNLKPSFETTLDLEMLLASAPGVYARGVDVYQSRPTGSVVLRALTAPLRHPNNRPDVISASLGICEPGLLATRSVGRAGADAFNRTLEVAAADGVSVVSSAGDAGSTACVNPAQPDRDAVPAQGGQLPRLLTVGDRGRRHERRAQRRQRHRPAGGLEQLAGPARCRWRRLQPAVPPAGLPARLHPLTPPRRARRVDARRPVPGLPDLLLGAARVREQPQQRPLDAVRRHQRRRAAAGRIVRAGRRRTADARVSEPRLREPVAVQDRALEAPSRRVPRRPDRLQRRVRGQGPRRRLLLGQAWI